MDRKIGLILQTLVEGKKSNFSLPKNKLLNEENPGDNSDTTADEPSDNSDTPADEPSDTSERPAYQKIQFIGTKGRGVYSSSSGISSLKQVKNLSLDSVDNQIKMFKSAIVPLYYLSHASNYESYANTIKKSGVDPIPRETILQFLEEAGFFSGETYPYDAPWDPAKIVEKLKNLANEGDIGITKWKSFLQNCDYKKNRKLWDQLESTKESYEAFEKHLQSVAGSVSGANSPFQDRNLKQFFQVLNGIQNPARSAEPTGRVKDSDTDNDKAPGAAGAGAPATAGGGAGGNVSFVEIYNILKDVTITTKNKENRRSVEDQESKIMDIRDHIQNVIQKDGNSHQQTFEQLKTYYAEVIKNIKIGNYPLFDSDFYAKTFEKYKEGSEINKLTVYLTSELSRNKFEQANKEIAKKLYYSDQLPIKLSAFRKGIIQILKSTGFPLQNVSESMKSKTLLSNEMITKTINVGKNSKIQKTITFQEQKEFESITESIIKNNVENIGLSLEIKGSKKQTSLYSKLLISEINYLKGIENKELFKLIEEFEKETNLKWPFTF